MAENARMWTPPVRKELVQDAGVVHNNKVQRVVAAAAAAVGLGRLWGRVVLLRLRLRLLLEPRSVRRPLRMWRVEEGAGGRRGVFPRLPRPAPVAHSVTDATAKGWQEGAS